MGDKFNIVTANVTDGTVCYADEFVGSTTGSISVDGDINCRGEFSASSDVVASNLPTSDPSVIGQLWDNTGSLNVSTKDVIYNQATMQIDIAAATPYISDISDGYIEFEMRDVLENFLSGAYYFFASIGGYTIEIGHVCGSSTLRFHQLFDYSINATFPFPSDGTLRITFDSGGHLVTLDGVEVDLTYSVGNITTPLFIPASTGGDVIYFNQRCNGYLHNLVIADGTTPVVSYAGDDGNATFVDSVNAANGTYEEWAGVWGTVTPETIGYETLPYYTKNYYVPAQTASPFASLPDILDDTPADIDRAFMKYKDTGLPIILDSGTADFPNWDQIPIANMERNTDCWYYSKAMTCFSVQSQFQGFAAEITAISPRHGIMAEHVRDDYPSTWQDKKIWFMDMNNNYQEVQAIDYENITITGGVTNEDVTVLLFNNALTLDMEYATFMTDAESNAYDSRDVHAVGPSKEGIFSIETESQMCSMGLRHPIEEQPEYLWSRWNNPNGDTERIGDSSNPGFMYNGTTLFYMFSALTKTYYAWNDVGSHAILNPMDRGMNNPTYKAALETGMDALDLRNGGLPNYNLVEKAI